MYMYNRRMVCLLKNHTSTHIERKSTKMSYIIYITDMEKNWKTFKRNTKAHYEGTFLK